MARTKATKAVTRNDAFSSCIQECAVAAAPKRHPEAAIVVCRETQLEKKLPAKIAKKRPSENLLQSLVMLLYLGVASYTLPQVLQHGYQNRTQAQCLHNSTKKMGLGWAWLQSSQPGPCKRGRIYLLPAARKRIGRPVGAD